MKNKVKKIAIVAKAETSAAKRIVQQAIKLAKAAGLQPVTDESTASLAKIKLPIRKDPIAISRFADLIMVIGGDGTMLHWARTTAGSGTPIFGVNVAFIIDSITFLFGTLMLLPLVIPQTYDKSSEGSIIKSSLKDIWLGQKRIQSEPRLLRIIFAKTSWNIAGGGLAGVFLVLAGNEITFVGAALGFGIFFFARGIGTGIGPILARSIFKDSSKWPKMVGLLIIVSGLFYVLVGLSLGGPILLTLALVTLAHTASGGNWVLSTVLTQQWVEDEMRGRVFSTDMLLMSIGQVISTISAGYLIEHEVVNLQQGILAYSILMVVSGIIFTLWNPKPRGIPHEDTQAA